MITTRRRLIWLCLSWLIIVSLLLPPNLAAALTLTPSPAQEEPLPPVVEETTAPAAEVKPAEKLTATPPVTATPVITVTPTVTATPVITATPPVTATPVITATPTVTATPVITVTPTVTATPVITATPTVTATPVVTDAGEGDRAAQGVTGGSSGIYGGWQLSYNAPDVALFRGAATYNYSFELPAARGQLQPALNLSYNSTRVDGILSLADSEWVGMGWSIDMVDIVRDGVSYTFSGNTQWLDAPDRFSLLLNGAGYKLTPAAAGADHGRYYAEGAPDIYVERINDCSDGNCANGGGSLANKTGEYWLVRTGAGATYRVGYDPDSEQVLYKVYNNNTTGGSGYIGRADRFAAYRWRVDYAWDVYGNTMDVDYREAYSSDEYGADTHRDTVNVINSLRYNNTGSSQWLTEIKFIPTSYTFEAQPGWANAPIFGRQGQLERLEIWQNGTRQGYYQFSYDVRPPLTSYPWEGQIRELRGIQRRSGDGALGLPATTFVYQDFPNKTICMSCSSYHEQVAYHYPRLVQIANGYGARTEFSYVNDGRANPTDQFYNYRVSEMRTYDGVHAAAALVTYEYGTRCYSQYGAPPGAILCRSNPHYTTGPLVGHNTVAVRAYDYNGTQLTRAVHTYHTDDVVATPDTAWRRGLEYQSQTYAGESTLRQQTATTWGSTALGETWFAHPDWITTNQYQGGVTTQSQVNYLYDAYNHVVTEYDYGDVAVSGDERSIHRAYYPNTSTWVVNALAWENVFATIMPNVSSSNLKTQTINYYDNHTSYTAQPDLGKLTRVERGGAGGPTVAAQYVYDAWGNLTQETDPNGNATVTTYETTYHQFPTQSCRQSLCTTTQYYGVNYSGAGFGLFGQPAQTYGSNGADTAVKYSYDAMGRLRKIVRPGDSLSYPSEEYLYYDGVESPFTNVWPMMVAHFYQGTAGAGWQNGGSWTREFYDGLGRLVQTQQPDDTWDIDGEGYEIVSYAEYDALGRVVKQSVPYSVAQYVYQEVNGQVATPYRTPDAAQATTRTRYDPNEQALRAPDGNSTLSYQVGRASIGIDANGQRRDQIGDAYGNLAQVYEYNNAPQTYEAEGSGSSHQVGSASGGAWLSPAGSGSGYLTYGPYQAPGAAEIGQIALFRLAIDSVSGANDVVARIEVNDVTAGQQVFASRELRRYEFVGGLSNFSEFGLTFDTSGRSGHSLEYRVYWYGQARLAHDRTRLSWTANRNSTQYAYDVLGNLTAVTDAAGNVTTMTYDSLSRKKKMQDPDMGTWYYYYDNAGNLIAQVDARKQATNFYYDAHNRLKGKTYATTSAPASYNRPGDPGYGGYSVKNYYDESDYGYSKGLRTRMVDASGSTAWNYDTRGRVTQESKVISGSGTFKTQWGYDSLDRMTWMKYPANNSGGVGEQVNTTYSAQGQESSVYGADLYASGAGYDAAGRITQRTLGNGAVYMTYAYYPWTTANGQGRLQILKAGASASPNNTSLQNLTYTYDADGNVLTIVDGKAGQTQTFTYDTLDRLKTASATGGTGGAYTTKTYTYNAIGNLMSKDGYNYWYESTAHRHAVTTLTAADTPVYSYGYDANGNQTTRNIRGSGTNYHIYDAENRLEQVTTSGSNTVTRFTYDGDGARVRQATYQNLAKGRTPTVASGITLNQPQAATNGDPWADSGSGSSGEFAYLTQTGLQYIQIDLGAVYSVDTVQVWHYAADGRTYHNAKTQVSVDGSTWYTVFDSATAGEYAETAQGKTHCFTARNVRYVRDYTNGSTVNAGNHWVEIAVLGAAANRAAGRTPTVASGITLNQPQAATDGDLWADSGSGSSGEFAYTTQTGLQYIQIDLGAVYSVDTVQVWHYAADGRTYHNTKTQVSADGSTWYSVFDSATAGEYAETAQGKTHCFTARNVRYVRDYTNGSTVNAGNHWVEIVVLGAAASDTSTTYVGNHFEWTGDATTMVKYYYAGGQRVAMRKGSTLTYLLGDHLGSTAISANSNGTLSSETRYHPWGATRYSNGTAPTAYQYTGQRNDAGIGLYFYGARYYDPALGRFVQADSIVPNPGDPQSLNRYSYTLNNPLKYTDPSGHFEYETIDGEVGELYSLLGFEDEQSYRDWWNGLPSDWQNTLLDAQWGDELTFTWNPQGNLDFGPMRMSMFFVSTFEEGNLVFWRGGYSMDFFTGEAMWLEAYQQTGKKGDRIPANSSRHPWRANNGGPIQGNGEYIAFDNYYASSWETGYAIALGISVPIVGVCLDIPLSVDLSMEIFDGSVAMMGYLDLLRNSDVPYVHQGSVDVWWLAQLHEANTGGLGDD